MASPTARLGLRVLEGADAADVPADLNQVTGILDHAAIDVGQGGFGGVPAAGTQGRYYYVNDRRQLLRDNGASWDVVGQAPPDVVTSMPPNPYDGMMVDVVASSGGGVVWRFRYRSASVSSYKWEFIGGAPLNHSVPNDEGTTSMAYADLATVGPVVTVPLSGEYIASFGAGSYNSSAESELMSLRVGGASPMDSEASLVGHGAANRLATHSRTITGMVLAGGTTLRAQYRVLSGGGAQFRNRWLLVTPVRVGG